MPIRTPYYAAGRGVDVSAGIEPCWQNNPLSRNSKRQDVEWRVGDTVYIKRGSFVIYMNGKAMPWQDTSEFIAALPRAGEPKRVRKKVIFRVERAYKNRRCKIIGPGYGEKDDYGRGPIFIWPQDLKACKKAEEK